MENNKFLRLAKKILWLVFAFFWMIQTASGETILQTSRGGVTFQIKTIAKGLGVPGVWSLSVRIKSYLPNVTGRLEFLLLQAGK